MVMDEHLGIVLFLNNVFAGEEVESFDIGPFVDDYLVLGVPGQVVVPVVEIDDVEYLRMEVVV